MSFKDKGSSSGEVKEVKKKSVSFSTETTTFNRELKRSGKRTGAVHESKVYRKGVLYQGMVGGRCLKEFGGGWVGSGFGFRFGEGVGL